jgi:hypothetical protein
MNKIDKLEQEVKDLKHKLSVIENNHAVELRNLVHRFSTLISSYYCVVCHETCNSYNSTKCSFDHWSYDRECDNHICNKCEEKEKACSVCKKWICKDCCSDNYHKYCTK